ncbi:MAG: MFS transporter [Alphaproteobacteria bacterium]|nr:MFS transporter [Alphaproteobacteria bacterium]
MVEARLGWLRLAAYGLPGLPLAALGIPLYVYLPTYYADDLGLGLATVGLVLLAARLWDALIDPPIGWLSDHWTTRFGRRRPWIALAVLPACAALWALFVPPVGASAMYLLGWTAILYLAWTMLQLPYTAWGAELSDDYHERSRIAGTREGFVILGTLMAVALPPTLLGAEAGRGASLALLAAALVVLLPMAVALALGAVPEPTRRAQPGPGWRAGLALLAENGPFCRLVLAYLLNGIANGLPATLFLLFVEDRLQLPAATGLMLTTYFLAGIAGVPLWLRLSRRWGKHRTWVAAMLWASAAFCWAPLLGPGDFWPYFALCALSGLALGADLVLPVSIQADVVDLDTADGGGRRTGLYFALWAMATKLALALAVGLAFPLLDAAGFRAGAANEPPALLALALLYGGLPVAFKLAASALVWKFPLDAAAQSALRQRIESRG